MPPEPKEPPKEPTLQDVVKAIQVLNNNQQQISQALVKVMKGEMDLPQVAKLKEEMASWKPDPSKVKDTEAPDPDAMSNKELTEHLVGVIQDKVIKPMTDQVRGIEEKFELYKAGLEVKGVKETHKDFDVLQGEIVELQKAHPSLGVEDLLVLARAKNPEKVKEFETKQAEENKEEAPAKFGGLFPNQTKTVPSTNMKFEDAVQKAWEDLDMDETLAAMPQA